MFCVSFQLPVYDVNIYNTIRKKNGIEWNDGEGRSK